MKKCIMCGQVFEKKDECQIYCSDKCLLKGRLTRRRIQRIIDDNCIVKPSTKNIEEINNEALEKGVSYGKYVAQINSQKFM